MNGLVYRKNLSREELRIATLRFGLPFIGLVGVSTMVFYTSDANATSPWLVPYHWIPEAIGFIFFGAFMQAIASRWLGVIAAPAAFIIPEWTVYVSSGGLLLLPFLFFGLPYALSYGIQEYRGRQEADQDGPSPSSDQKRLHETVRTQFQR